MSKKNRDVSRQVREMQAAQRAAEQRRRNLLISGAAIAVIVVLVGLGLLWMQTRDDAGPTAAPKCGTGSTGSGAADPDCVTASFGVPVGQPSAPVTVTVYEDFQCPICKEFEQALGPFITTQVDAGDINVEYRPIAFLDRASTTNYSSRAAETAACTLNAAGVDGFVALHTLLFANQPAENTAGLSDAELADLAAQAGANKADLEACQDDDTFASWVTAATDHASKDQVTGTPTYRVNDETVTFTDTASAEQTLQAAIDSAGSN